MKQSTIKVILGVMVLLGLLSSLTSCTVGDGDTIDTTSVSKSKADIILPGRDLHSNIKRALNIDSNLNIYSPGDTVWVQVSTGRITQNTWTKSIISENYSLFVITGKTDSYDPCGIANILNDKIRH